jgi:hypothetical protein
MSYRPCSTYVSYLHPASSSRTSGLATLLGVSGVVKLGVDIPALLAEWGLGDGAAGAALVGGTVASLAAASAANALCVPLHFGAAVYGTQLQERFARVAADAEASAKGWTQRQDFQRQQQQQNQQQQQKQHEAQEPQEQAHGGGSEDNTGEDGGRKQKDDAKKDQDPRGKHQEMIMGGFSMVLLALSLVISMYGVKVMATTGADALAAATAAPSDAAATGNGSSLAVPAVAAADTAAPDSGLGASPGPAACFEGDATEAPPVASMGGVDPAGCEFRTSGSSDPYVK